MLTISSILYFLLLFFNLRIFGGGIKFISDLISYIVHAILLILFSVRIALQELLFYVKKNTSYKRQTVQMNVITPIIIYKWKVNFFPLLILSMLDAETYKLLSQFKIFIVYIISCCTGVKEFLDMIGLILFTIKKRTKYKTLLLLTVNI